MHVENNDEDHLERILESVNLETSIFEIKDERSMNLILICAFNESTDCLRFLLNYAKYDQELSDFHISQFLNEQTPDHKRAAIHYASLSGDVEMVRLLLDFGADYQIKTKDGKTVVHCASEGDQPVILAFFQDKY